MSRKLRKGNTQTGHRLLLGLLFSTGIGFIAYKRRTLSKSGIGGAIVTGTTIVGLGGWSWGLSLIFFFVSSSLLSHFRAHDKEQVAVDKFSKSSQRDIIQVFANGGLAALLAIGYGLVHTPWVRQLFHAGFTGAIATATADTWATELGVLCTQAPRLITTGRPVAPGTSGGITLVGTGASALGALASGLVFWLLQRCQKTLALLPFMALVSGLVGSMADSLLGATIQAMYYCPTCQKETERHIHSCGTTTTALRGSAWFNNDVVNLLATLIGGLTAIGLQLCAFAKNNLKGK